MSVHSKLIKVREAVRHIPKQTSQGLRYSYRSFEQAYESLRGHLDEHGVSIALMDYRDLKVSEYERKGTLWTSVSFVFIVAFVDSEDLPDRIEKGNPKVVWWEVPTANSNTGSAQSCGGAISYGMKYALLTGFMVPTEDKHLGDPDHEHAKKPSHEDYYNNAVFYIKNAKNEKDLEDAKSYVNRRKSKFTKEQITEFKKLIEEKGNV